MPKKTMKKLPISAVVVTRNESKYLQQCLDSISYCSEIIVIDLESTDDSVAIAKRVGAKVISQPPVPYIEIIHCKLEDWVSHEWVLITDPDEVADQGLQNYICAHFAEWSSNVQVGVIRAPMTYYVGDRPFYGTGWGPTNKSRTYIVNMNRFEFLPLIHKGRKLKDGFIEVFIDPTEGVIHHYWVESLAELVAKCKRYLRHEGQTPNTPRKSAWQLLKLPLISFYSSFIVRKGYADGLLGFSLSLILTWYNTSAEWKKFRH